MGRLNGKTVVVTGAASGLGRATALALANEGAGLALTDIDEKGLALVSQQVEALGSRVVTLGADISRWESHASLRDLALSTFGGVHGLCNVAGILGPGTIEDISEAGFDQVMHVNCLAQMLAVKAFAPSLRASGGSIVNVASVGAQVGLPLMSLYCASKAAVLGLTRALAVELAPHVRCNAVCPGGIDTPMSQALLASVPSARRDALLGKLTGRQLIPRFATPEEIAATLVFLVSDDSAFLTGSTLSADGGHTAW